MVDQSIKTELFALQLGQQLLDAYQFRLFGNVSKPEIDIMVFSCAVKILLSDHECVRNSNGEINWLRLSTGEFIRIGTHLKFSKACVQSLVEQAYAFVHDSEFSAQEVIEELLALLQSSESTSDHGQPGAIKLQVSNPDTRLALESFFVTSGGIVDGSFTRDLLVLRTADVLSALLADANNKDVLLQQMVAASQSYLPADQADALGAQAQNELSPLLLNRLADLAAQTPVHTTTRWSLSSCLTCWRSISSLTVNTDMAQTLPSSALSTWLEQLLRERISSSLALFFDPDIQFWKLKSAESDAAITFCQIPGLYQLGDSSDLPCANWDVEAEGFKSIEPYLQAPGCVQAHQPLLISTVSGFHLNYDIPGITYWMLARCEEVDPPGVFLDNHERFSAMASHAFHHSYLERPLVDEWIGILRQVIERLWPRLPLVQHQFQVVVSHDVDRQVSMLLVHVIYSVRT